MTILPTPQPKDTLVDIKTVCTTLCRSRASLYRDIQRGDFPEPIKLGGSSRWRMSDLNKIIDPEAPLAA
ncbi:AlpA family transcriptional regulator [Phaeobacter inhibens]|uniref:helix-turn-helix transcriptional regulator n=1 Tax=Phaeobacter inhibens TaxID=221822 RepID=UPI00041935E0|nr:AlpA family phage regulatory protein [Phaeobacter inhibens]